MGKAKKHKQFSKEDAEEYNGGGLKNYFGVAPPKKKRGRPTKSISRGRPKNITSTPPRKSPPEIATTTADVGEEDEDTNAVVDDDDDDDDMGAPKKKKKKKKTRTNWGKPPHRAKMEKAISDWFKKEGDAIDSNGEPIEDMHVYAGLIDIPFNSLYKYLNPNEDERGFLEMESEDDLSFWRWRMYSSLEKLWLDKIDAMMVPARRKG